jgi:hypothetical protein
MICEIGKYYSKNFLFSFRIFYIFIVMKLISSILIIHILLLTVAPAISGMSFFQKKMHCNKSCCSTDNVGSRTHRSKQNRDCCKNGICNPFMACCNCSALTVQVKHISSPFTYLNQQFNIETKVFSSNFLSDAWNPPKLI